MIDSVHFDTVCTKTRSSVGVAAKYIRNGQVDHALV